MLKEARRKRVPEEVDDQRGSPLRAARQRTSRSPGGNERPHGVGRRAVGGVAVELIRQGAGLGASVHQRTRIRLVGAGRVQGERGAAASDAGNPSLSAPLSVGSELADPTSGEVVGQQLVAYPRDGVEVLGELSRTRSASPEGTKVSPVEPEDPDLAVQPVGDVHGLFARAEGHARDGAEVAWGRFGGRGRGVGADRRNGHQVPLRRVAAVHDTNPRARGVDGDRQRIVGPGRARRFS